MKNIFNIKNKFFTLTLSLLVFFAISGGVVLAGTDNVQSDKGLSLETMTDNLNFSAKNEAELEFALKKERNTMGKIGAFFKSIFVDEYKGVEIEAKVKEEGNIATEVEYDKNGKFALKLKTMGRQIKPGKHSVEVIVKDSKINNGEAISFSQDFTWGVLAFNPDQSVYLKDSLAYLQAAVLSDNGDTICNAKVSILIDEPGWGKQELSTENGGVIRNPACGLNNVIDTPDYYANYKLEKTGVYQIIISADTENGVRTITDTIIVEKNLPFVVKRSGPTRIYPKSGYPMKISVTANEDFEGDLLDTVPMGFQISDLKLNVSGQVREIKTEKKNLPDAEQIVLKDLVLKKGETAEFSYKFDAPDVSPEFFLLGPLEAVSQKDGKVVTWENRSWQIASDALRTIGHYYVNDNTAYSGLSGGVWARIAGYQIPSATFVPGKKYLISINFSLNNSSANANARAQVLHGSTQFPGSLYNWESAQAGTTRTGHGYQFFTVWTAVAGESIEVEVTNSSSVTYYATGYEAFVINLSDDLVENTDWYYAANTNAGNLTTAWSTNGASISIAGGGNDWMILGLGHFLSDSTSADFMMRLFNSTDAVGYNAVRYEAEDTLDERPIVLMSGVNISGTKTFRPDAMVDTVTTHDWTNTAIFAMNLDKFQSHYIGYSTDNVALNALNTWFPSTSTPFMVKATGDHLIWSQDVADVIEATKIIQSQITVDSTVVPNAFPNLLRETSHGTTNENALHNFYLGSLSAGTRVINSEHREIVDIVAPPVIDIQNLVAFSMELKTPPTAEFNSAVEKTNGSGAVDLSLEVADADWEYTRAKLEYVAGAACNFASPLDPSLDTSDANTSADYGDPTIDNGHAYQVGTTSAYILTDSGPNTVELDWLSKTNLPLANGEIYCLRVTANDLREDQNPLATTTVQIDNAVPVISSIVTSNLKYKIGDTLRATATVASEYSDLTIGPSSNINGGSLTNIQKANNTTFTFDYTIISGQSDRATGTIPYSISLVDTFGNRSATSSANFANGSIDAHEPSISGVVIPDNLYGIGDTMTATITVASDADVYRLGASTINGVNVVNLKKINNTTYTVDYTVIEGNTTRAHGTIPYSIILIDSYDNTNSAYSGNFSNGSLDATRPVISAVYLTNGNYGINNTMSVVINADGLGYSESTITINGKGISGFTDNGNNTYTVYYTVAEGDTDRSANTIPISIILSDTHGNTHEAFTTPAANSATIDATKPEILTIVLPNQAYRIGQTIQATVTITADTNVYTLGTTSINGVAAGNLNKVNDSTYTFEITVLEGNTDRSAGTIPVSVMLKDQLDQYNNPAFTTVSVNTASIDANSPVISSITFSPSSGILIVGETATATISLVGAETGATFNSASINGVNVLSSFSELGGGDYQLVYTVSEGNIDHPDNDDLPVNIVVVDASGNTANQYTQTDPNNRPGVDAHTPTITSVTFAPSSGVLKVGDTATATIAVSGAEAGLLVGSTMTINSVDVRASFSDLGGGNYRVTYKIVEGNNDIADTNDLPVDINIIDTAGNVSASYTTADTDNRPGVDGHTPTITSVSFSPTSGVLKVGDTATATISVSNSETGLQAGNTMTINGVNVASSFSDIGGGNYTVTYTVGEGNTDRLDSADLPISLSVKDSANNLSPVYNTADINNRPGVDAHTPTIASVTFAPSSGVLKVGDTATATIAVSGGEAGLLIGPTMTINSVDVRASFSDLGGGNYRVTYTVSEGNTDRQDSADLPVSFNIVDTAGNTSNTFVNADIANRPGVDGHTPSITSVSFNTTSGVLKVGDIATATISVSNSESGLQAGNSMTINGVNVAPSFKDIGGGNYTVTYTVGEGNTDRLDSADLPINLSVKDSANNQSPAYNTADINNRPGVDAHTPNITSVTFVPSSGVLKVGDTATATIAVSGAEAGLLVGPTMTINGVDVRSSYSDLGGGNYRVTYTVSEGNIDRADSADLPVSINIVDTAGNISNSFVNADIANRPGVDGHAPTTPGNLSYARHNNNSITIGFGAAVTEANFQEYKIFYKIGDSGVSESDSEWNSTDDINLASRTFSSATSTTITGLNRDTDYIFNIFAYDTAGNKSVAEWELSASTNKTPTSPSDLVQKENNNTTVVANGEWAIDQTVLLTSSASDIDNNFVDFYYEVLPIASSFSTATTPPSSSCHSGDSFNDCAPKIWKYSTGPAWYDTDWEKRKQITIDADLVEADETNFPVLSSSIDEDLKREARSDGHDIIFTAADGVTPLSFERKLWDPATGQLISWIETDLSSSSDNFIYMYYGNADHSTDLSTTTGVWDSSYLGVWHMDEAPTGSADDIKDSSGNNRHMTSYNMNSAKRVRTDTGYAYEFDGAGDYLEDADGENYVNGLSAFTVELWLKSDVIASDRGFIIGSVPAGNDSYFTLRYDEAGANAGNVYHNLVKGAITITGPTEKQYESSAGVQTTNWQHLVFRWISGGQYEVFVNGQYDSYTFNSPAGAGVTAGADRLRIGQGGKDITAALGWDGLIDEVRISNVYRTDAFVKTAYNNQANLNSFALFGAQESVRIYNLPESSSGYKWQVMTCDEHGACSAWVPYDVATPNFKVDNTAPTAPGSLSENSKTSVSATLNFGATTTESFFSEYRIYYKIFDGVPVSTNDNLFTAVDDSNLGNILFNSKATTTVTNLTAGTSYQFNIWAVDQSGQMASATPITVTTNAGSNPPTGLFNSVAQKTNGSGVIDISVEIDDLDNSDTVRMKLEYVAGAACNFATPLDPTLDANGDNITADHGDPDIDNNQAYQVGSSTAYVMTSPGSNTVNFDWLSATNLPNANGVYCLRLTASDGQFDQVTPATTTIYIDNLEPTTPGALSLAQKNTYGLVLDFGTESTEDNFATYKIFYKQGTNGVTESDIEHIDSNLEDRLYSGKATTTVAGLVSGTNYVFNIWAYDDYGNKSNPLEQTFTTNFISGIPSALTQKKNDNVTAIINSTWTDENNVRLSASALDSDTSEILTLYFEMRPSADSLLTATSIPANACTVSENYGICSSKVWAVTSSSGNYSVTPFSGQVHPGAIPDSSSGYKWQVMACDDNNACSEWANAGSIPNFKIDTINPGVPGNLSFVSRTHNSLKINFGASSTEANFREYIIYYKVGASGVSESDIKHSSSSDINLFSQSFNGAGNTTINGLLENTEYVINIWAYDQVGRKASAVSELVVYTNARPSGSFGAKTQRADGTGIVDFAIILDDINDDNLRAKIEYVAGSACNFASPLDPSLDETDANASSTYGDAKIFNNESYQIGTSSGWIITSSGANTIDFDWLSALNVPSADNTYCLRLTANDMLDDQAISATTTITIDNLNPSVPGNLTLASSDATSIRLNFGATSTERNFSRYRIFYKVGVASVLETDLEKTDTNLLNILFNGATSTLFSGLLYNTQYSFKIFAYDIWGNKSSSGQTTFTTNAPPSGYINSIAQKTDGSGIVDISIEAYDINLDNCQAKIEYVAGLDCDFSVPLDPTLDVSSENISSDYGTVTINNNASYHIGSSSKIITTSGSNTVNFDWLAGDDMAGADGFYCVRLTVNDGQNDQLISATTTFAYDDALPTTPGNLSVDFVDGVSARLNFGLPGSDTNFKEYKIFYKEAISGVTQSDLEFNRNNDINLGEEDFNLAANTTIYSLKQNTDYVFNIWIYDEYGNYANAAGEVATTTPIILSANWREEEDTEDPTASVQLGRGEHIRLRLGIANTRDWDVDAKQYDLEYGPINGTCEEVTTWTTVDSTVTNQHFGMVSSSYFENLASTTAKLINLEGYTFEPGYMVEGPSNKTLNQDIPAGSYTELEFNIEPTIFAIPGQKYCFRTTNEGELLDNYEIYPEFTLAPAPKAEFVYAGQKNDASEIVDIVMDVVDVDGDNVKVKLEYESGSSCSFASPLDPSLDESSENISADFGNPLIDNNSEYQIGTTSGWITTSFGTNTVAFDWNTLSDLTDANGTYCLRLTARDDMDIQTELATTTLVVDHIEPSQPGYLSAVDISSNSVTLGLGTSSVDTNFKEYKIFYKEGSSGVTESDSLWGSSSDAHLGLANYGNATTTTVTGLQVNKQYVFQIWAYDKFGHKAVASQEVTVVIKYVSRSEGWRWYADQQNETPTTTMAMENVTPIDVADGASVKLRLILREIESITGENVKIRLEYSTFSDFSADVHFVGEQSSSTVLWTYGDGVDNDNDPVLEALISGNENGATHNESGISTTSYSHIGGTAAEWEFTIRSSGAQVGQTYYFRAYDNTNGEAIIVNTNFSYPSAMIASPNLSYTVDGYAESQMVEGVNTTINASYNNIDFGSLISGNDEVAAHKFIVDTNAGGGYQLLVYQRQSLLSANGADINPVPYPNAAPNAWPENPDPSAFGYHAGDDTLSGASPSRFSADNTYAGFQTGFEEISYSSIPVQNEVVDLVIRLEAGEMQEAGDYETELVYILLPTFYE